ncbi:MULTISPECIES: ABC transporter ATP-binding protein [unclassified Frondihabitans]|uniref:ATP-binding cassette domain-containing protein n=1 Tax=unclassified Frondihabitans TaxID=2626248 RepID=UPI000FAB50BA|nr:MULTISPECIES: ABC transporter ATP-binding protein [unclassified Frondihabitans]RPE74299.1 ABC-type dipeptide/oligopeptide/nickel transport system ATPase component [Frondihabitans sp. PhB153]RPF02728.1 ABC-type dipeptide/oligopeptide/nickel transport system ATPase component [Frondihabitans sp. PhB161]
MSATAVSTTAATDPSGLVVTDLTIRGASGVALVDELSFAIAPGRRLGIIGESGSGKSLTALAVLGLLPEALVGTGSVRLSGNEVIGTAERALVPLRGSEVAIVFQEPLTSLDPLMRVGRQLAEPVRRTAARSGQKLSRAEVLDRVREALVEMSLPDPDRIASAYPHEISGGQRQRVAIALALASRPKLLIADEPTTALDVSVQAEILALLDRVVADRGMALLFISHDLAVVSRVADDVVVLREGRVVDRGSLAVLIDAPGSDYTAELVAGARVLDDALDAPGRPS